MKRRPAGRLLVWMFRACLPVSADEALSAVTEIDGGNRVTFRPVTEIDGGNRVTFRPVTEIDGGNRVTFRPVTEIDGGNRVTFRPVTEIDGGNRVTFRPVTEIDGGNRVAFRPVAEVHGGDGRAFGTITQIKSGDRIALGAVTQVKGGVGAVFNAVFQIKIGQGRGGGCGCGDQGQNAQFTHGSCPFLRGCPAFLGVVSSEACRPGYANQSGARGALENGLCHARENPFTAARDGVKIAHAAVHSPVTRVVKLQEIAENNYYYSAS